MMMINIFKEVNPQIPFLILYLSLSIILFLWNISYKNKHV